MKIFFWVMWSSILGIVLFLLKGILGMVFHKYNPIPVTSVISASAMVLLGAGLLAGSYYFYQAGKLKWACGIAGLPLLGITMYFLAFLILPYVMGERMN